jgi:CheY-like chemotaxis protein
VEIVEEVNAEEKEKRYILVVDTDTDDRFFTCMLLQRFGYDIFSACSAEKAIEYMTVVPPSTIVSDADRNGPTLLSWLAQDPRFLDTPLILGSWWPHPELEERAAKGEFVACLRKPIDVLVLYRTIQAALEKSPRRNLRIEAHLRTRLEDGQDGSDGYATIISEYGMFFRSLNPRPVNARIPLAVEIKGRLIKTEAVVLYVLTFGEGPFSEPGMGMKFVNMSRADREFIAAFILEQINEGIRQKRPG